MLAGRWENFLLGCVNCNSTKGDSDVRLDSVFLPDRDNTAAAFQYTADGKISPAATLSAPQRQLAAETLRLVGLDRATDRTSQRIQAWAKALVSKDRLQASPSPDMRKVVVLLARSEGFFSVWMQVFSDDEAMRRDLIAAFSGTAADCFDTTTRPVSPRPGNGLPHSGKV